MNPAVYQSTVANRCYGSGTPDLAFIDPSAVTLNADICLPRNI
jgi:hypothetical protein